MTRVLIRLPLLFLRLLHKVFRPMTASALYSVYHRLSSRYFEKGHAAMNILKCCILILLSMLSVNERVMGQFPLKLIENGRRKRFFRHAGAVLFGILYRSRAA